MICVYFQTIISFINLAFLQYLKYFNNIRMASRWYAQNVSEDSSSDEQKQQVTKTKVVNYEYDDDFHDSEHRVVQTEKQKKQALFSKIGHNLTKSVNNQDWDKACDHLQQLLKEVQKAKKYIDTNGYPSSVLKAIKNLNDQVNSITPEDKKKMKNTKSFNILRQKLRKAFSDFQKALQDFQDAPSQEQKSEEDKQSESSSDESQSDIYRQYLKSSDPMVRRKYWLKRDVKKTSDKDSSSSDQSQKQITKKNQDKKRFHLVKQKERKTLIIKDSQQAQERIKKIIADYAKLKSVEKGEEYLSDLDVIVKESKSYSDSQRLSILLAQIPIRMEVVKQMRNFQNSRQLWQKLFRHLQMVFQILRQSEDEDLVQKIVYFDDNDEQQKKIVKATEKSIYEMIKTFIVSLERDIHVSFKYLNNKDVQYSQRLQDLIKFTDFMYSVSKDMNFKEQLQKCAAQIGFKVLQNCYFMSADFMQTVSKFSQISFKELSDEETLDNFVKPILALRNQEITTKTILYIAFNHALNRREKARDLLASTNIHQIVSGADYYIKACFNRAVVQLAISSFCRGNLYETQQILDGLCGLVRNRGQNKQNIREYLAQNIPNQKERKYPTKYLPYYLHMNVDLIQAIELISSMVLQVPYTFNEGGRINSKTVKRVFFQYERSHFLAEPLNYRDLVYAASNSLKLGNWKQCYDKLLEIDIWTELGNPSQAQANLLANIKQSSLRCYLMANRKCFRCVSLKGLSQKFQLQLKVIRKLICKWINQKDRQLLATITDDGYLKIPEKREEKESELQKVCEKLFIKLQDINNSNEQFFRQNMTGKQQDQQGEIDGNFQRKINLAITDKLKTILNRRAA